MNPQLKSVEIIPMPAISWGNDFYKDVSVLKVVTREGLVGLGAAYTSAKVLKRVWAAYSSQVDFYSLALDQVQKIVAQVCEAGLHVTQPELVPALSALDIALWDLHGHRAGQSVASLIGGATSNRIKAYASLEIPLPKANSDFADFEQYLRSMLAQNFKAIKLYFPRLGYRDRGLDSAAYGFGWTPAQWDQFEEQLFARARDIVGPKIDLMLDVFGSADDWVSDMDWAVKTCNRLEQYGFLWFEEPFRPEDMSKYRALSARTSLSLSACEFFTDPSELELWAQQQVVSILQPDCTCSGGVSTLVRVRDAALAKGVTMIPHGWSTAVGMAADIQVMATMPEGPLRMVEYMPKPSVTSLLKGNPFMLGEDGMVEVSQKPGLGVALRESY